MHSWLLKESQAKPCITLLTEGILFQKNQSWSWNPKPVFELQKCSWILSTNTLEVSVCSKYAGSQRSYVGAKVWLHGQDVQNALQCSRGMQEALAKNPSQDIGNHGVFLAFSNTWRISVKTDLRLFCALVALRTIHLCWWITYRVWSLFQTPLCFTQPWDFRHRGWERGEIGKH